MSSIIEGYSYDIFISYRQKDNKHDGWVTKFVDNLKGELEATFKEDISVYFDENPHDRLQETYDVDKSLEGKLKCLIFIPILSQTYCDPNSYAWQHEFLAFLQMVKNDRFGKDVRLRGGNVASRVLPIRIHDLEPEDIKLYEKETNGVLRAVDFVFKTSSGISRPLLSNEDHPNDNLNKTYYRDQISKVAYTIKEIVLGMKAEPVMRVEEKSKVKESSKEFEAEDTRKVKEKPAKAGKVRFLIPMAIVALLIIAGIIAYPKIFKKDAIERLRESGERISVAVMPFQNLTLDTTNNFWQEGIQEILTTSLANSEELIIKQTQSVKSLIKSRGVINYVSLTPDIASSVSKKLDANVFVYGNLIMSGNVIRLNAQLLRSGTEEVFKSFQINGTTDKMMSIIDSLSTQIRNFLIISESGKGNRRLENIKTTKSAQAYKYFRFGLNAEKAGDGTSAVKWFKEAVAVDSTFSTAISAIIYTYVSKQDYKQAKEWALKFYKNRDLMDPKGIINAEVKYAWLFQTPNEEIQYLRQLLDIDEQDYNAYSKTGNAYYRLNQYDKVIQFNKKALEIVDKLNYKPDANVYYELIYSYFKTDQYKQGRKLFRKAISDFPDNPEIYRNYAIMSLGAGDTKEAESSIEKLKSLRKENLKSEADIMAWLGSIYSEAGIIDKAEEYYRKALSIQPDSVSRKYSLAVFLILKDRGINEGVEILDQIIKLYPRVLQSYGFLDRYGWGLYKQGKYKEALDILQKSWNLRKEKAIYNHEAYLHLEAAKKAVVGQKNN